MPNCLARTILLLFIAVTLQAQPKPPTASDMEPLGFGGVLAYLVVRDFGPALKRKLLNGRSKVIDHVTELDKESAVGAAQMVALTASFREHVLEDRQNFADLRETLVEVQKGQSRIEGILERFRQ